jgi:beta-phosphoglucomutase family hydrolase
VSVAELNSQPSTRAEASAMPQRVVQLPAGITCCLFDLDGVLTSTARQHAKAWKSTFDRFLASSDAGDGGRRDPFDIAVDYREYVDGRQREDGVRSFLESRSISIPEGSRDDPPGAATVFGLANAKNSSLLDMIRKDGVDTYPGSIQFVRAAREAGLSTAVVSASANTKAVLAKAKISDLFAVVIDGNVAAQRGLRGKPQPDTYLAAARDLGADPSHAAVFEDALAGIDAGRAGGFGCVIGVNRDDGEAELFAHGADLVVADLSELAVGRD